MKTNQKKKLIDIIERFHRYIFKTDMGPKTRKFLEDLSYVFVGSVFTSFLVLGANILVARIIGSQEYGYYQLIAAFATFLIIPMTLGFDTATVRYLAKGKDQKNIISTLLITVLFLSLITSIILSLLKNSITNFFLLKPTLIYPALIFGVTLSFYYVSEAILRGLNNMKMIASLNIVRGILLIISIGISGLLIKINNFNLLLFPTVLSYLVISLMVFFMIKSYIKKFDYSWFKKLFRYGFYAVLGGISGTLLQHIDKIVINFYLGAAQVGIYAAYVTSTYLLFGKVLQVFLLVFFPMVSRTKDKRRILEKIDKLSKILFLTIIIISPIICYIILRMYGQEYPIIWSLVILFSVNISIYFLTYIKLWFFASIGEQGVKYTSLHTIIAMVLNFFLNILLIPHLRLQGAILATIISTIYLFASVTFILPKKVGIKDV